jgi:hypothetical protein
VNFYYDIIFLDVINSCSTWSERPQLLDTAMTNLEYSSDLSIKQVKNVTETEDNQQLLIRFLEEYRHRYQNQSHRIMQQNNAAQQEAVPHKRETPLKRIVKRSVFQTNHFKSSGSGIKDKFGRTQAIFFDRFNNILVSDYINNRVLKYDAASSTEEHTSVVAENLDTPRGLYVTNDGSMLYVVDNKGVHRIEIGNKEKNLGTSSLLFCLDSSSEVYNMIVDEDDFYAIYLFDITRQRVQRCRHFPHNLGCETIINVTGKRIKFVEMCIVMSSICLAENGGPIETALMTFNNMGDLSVVNSATNVVRLYKHDKDGCRT